jgi:hypothetical protein
MTTQQKCKRVPNAATLFFAHLNFRWTMPLTDAQLVDEIKITLCLTAAITKDPTDSSSKEVPFTETTVS